MNAVAVEQVQTVEAAPQALNLTPAEQAVPAAADAPAQEQPAEPVRRLAPAREDGGRRIAPPREAPAAPRAEEAPEEPAGEPQAKAAPSPRALRTFTEKWKGAKSPEDRRKALAFALEKNVITQADLEALQGKEPAAPRAAPAAGAAPAAPPGQPPAAGAAPATQPTQAPAPGAAPAAPPEVPKIHGQPVPAVMLAAEKIKAVTDRLAAKGAELGWNPVKGEPMRLFEDYEGGTHAFEVTGNVTKRLVELGAVELAALQGGGGNQSTLGRRLELGMLALTVGGPAATLLASRASGALVGKVSAVARALASQVRRWRR
ncbi:hypothetical protein [Stigmatella erecta]|uniref:Uncharacterized protein n=1 Tax=Stigmatella erecta TaxID=83460 RepID=A0A1I0LA88_9BACT|nr:hypothetical protein [Stigmatella erecta]SEU36926.1 hypothetical protein SAMN05443639_12314 [Stigmatella erecta]